MSVEQTTEAKLVILKTLELLRRAALDLSEAGASDPVIQRHFANVANQAIDLLLDEEGADR